jgi:hypothetical protein
MSGVAIHRNKERVPEPSHSGSVYELSIVEDDMIVAYSDDLGGELRLTEAAKAVRWYQAMDINVSVADGLITSAMGATRRMQSKRARTESMKAKQAARTIMNRLQRGVNAEGL